MVYFYEALNPHPERKQNEGEDEADLITNLPPKVKRRESGSDESRSLEILNKAV